MGVLSEAEKKACVEIFDVCDINNSGTLTFDEIVSVVRGLGWEEDMVAEHDIKKWFADLSINFEEGINQNQFLQAYGQSYLKDRRLVHLKKVFKDLDTDKSGTLSVDELFLGFQQSNLSATYEDVTTLVRQMGSESGQFNITDFVNFFRVSTCFSEISQ